MRCRTIGLFLLATALLLPQPPLPLAAQEPAFTSLDDPLPVDPQVIMGTLDNGLRYFVRANSRPESRAELRLVVNVGSVLEDDDQRGLAHFLEHMAFNGTANFEKQALVDYLESIGMAFGPEVNAYTSFDETVYMLQVPTDDPEILSTALQILEDWAYRVTLEPEEVDRERGVVIEEWRAGRGAMARMMDRQFPLIFQGSRYADRLVIGDLEILETFPPETLRRFYDDWYRPDLMAVVAVGDFDPAAMETAIRDHFSRVPEKADARPRVTYDLPPHEETLYAIAGDAEATSSQVSLLFKQPLKEQGTLDGYRQLLVDNLFNGMLNARLFELTQQANPPFAAAMAGQGRFVRSAEIFQLAAVAPDGGIDRGMSALLTEAERVVRHGFTPSELERQKADLLRSLERGFAERGTQPSGRFASEYVNHFLQNDPIPGIEFEFRAAQALLPSISTEEVTEVGRGWLVDHSRVVLVNAPEKEGLPLPTEEALAAVFQEAVQGDIPPYEDSATEEPLLAEIPTPSPVVDDVFFPDLGVTEWRLGNGVLVILKPTDFKDDQVLVQAFSPGGYSLSSLETHLSASNADQMVALGGVGSFNRVDLMKKLAGKSASVSPSISENTEGFSGQASPQDLETLFQLIYLYFTAPRKDDVAFQALTSQLEAVLANRDADPMNAFQDTLLLTMSQGHPRVRPMNLENFKKIHLDEAFSFYKDRFADASDFTFLFVGALDIGEIQPLVETYLGGLPNLGREESWRDLDVDPPVGVIEKTVRKGVEPQSLTQIVFTGPFESTPDSQMGIRAMSSVLESRLLRLVREDLSGTYGVQVSPGYSLIPDPRYQIRIQFGSDPARVDELVEAVFGEIRVLIEEGPTPEDVRAATEKERRSRETSMKENGWWLGQLRSAYFYGWDPHLALDEGPLNRVAAETIQRDAGLWLRLDNYVRVSLFPEKGEN